MKFRWLMIALLVSSVLALWPAASHAQTQPITWQVAPGFDGSFKSGAWFPVTITVSNSGPDVRGTLSVRLRTGQATTYSQPIDLPLNAQKRVVLPVLDASGQSGALEADVTLRDGDTVLRTQRIRLNAVEQSALAVGVISDDATALPELSNLRAPQQGAGSLLRIVPADLPDRAELLQSFDVLFVHDVDTSVWTDAQRTALNGWIVAGGQLVVGGDTRSIAGLADLLPTTAQDGGETTSLQGLTENNFWRLRSETEPVRVLRLAPRDGADVVLRGDAGQPLLVRGPRGAGEVLQTAFALPVLSQAGNVPSFWRRALDLNALPAPVFGGQLRDQGFWTLQNALDLPALRVLSPLGLIGFLLVYILLVGPVNYLILRRLDRREWAYLTIPLLVLVFSGGAYLWGTLGRGQSALLNQLSIVQVQGEQGQATTFATLFSPSRTAYTLDLPTDALVTDLVPQWQRQGDGIDVLYAEDRVRVPDLLVDIGTVRGVVAEHRTTAPLVEISAVGEDQLTIRNRSDRDLQDVAVVRSDGQAQLIGALAAGAEQTVELRFNRTLQDGLEAATDGVIDRQVVLRELGNSVLFQPFAEPAFIPEAEPLEDLATPTPDGADPAATEEAVEAAPVEAYPVPGQPFAGVPERDRDRDGQPDRQLWLFAWDAQGAADLLLNEQPAARTGDSLYIWPLEQGQ